MNFNKKGEYVLGTEEQPELQEWISSIKAVCDSTVMHSIEHGKRRSSGIEPLELSPTTSPKDDSLIRTSGSGVTVNTFFQVIVTIFVR